jgi:hypothetical protein
MNLYHRVVGFYGISYTYRGVGVSSSIEDIPSNEKPNSCILSIKFALNITLIIRKVNCWKRF